MRKEDFEFLKYNEVGKYHDFWFSVSGTSKEELENEHNEMCMRAVVEVVYSEVEDIVGVKRIFDFNWDVVLSSNEELKAILKEKTNILRAQGINFGAASQEH